MKKVTIIASLLTKVTKIPIYVYSQTPPFADSHFRGFFPVKKKKKKKKKI